MDETRTKGDLREGYAGSRDGVILPSPARCAWVLPNNRAARMVGSDDSHTTCDWSKHLAGCRMAIDIHFTFVS